ncbi:DUF3149 domain-containing protein [Sinimarinibacterium sp. CAU 1509]|nr:DUF3149 domain-containing protein [Sinimarinibacterium sp. CAU 1509]TJY64905.1 DUF3149 domain-containing protein [Sinimarinibacterium sp. CAU 1509]
MKLVHDLFTSDVGLMSAGVIAFVIVMGFYINGFVRRKIREDEAAAAKR